MTSTSIIYPHYLGRFEPSFTDIVILTPEVNQDTGEASMRIGWKIGHTQYTDYSYLAQQQTGSTCGYHAAYNLAIIMRYLQGAITAQEVREQLEIGPDIELHKAFILSLGNQLENIDDGDIAFLAHEIQKLPQETVTIIPSIKDWNPSQHERFDAIARHLQTTPGALHGFLINTGGHIHTRSLTHVYITPTQKIAISSVLNEELQAAFPAYIENHADIGEQKLQIVNQIIDHPELLEAFLNHGRSATYGGHWTAVVAYNNAGTLQLHVADSSYNTDTISYGNFGTLEQLHTWLVMNPKHLEALHLLPPRLETAKQVMLQNKNMQRGQEIIDEIKEIIKAADLQHNHYYKTNLDPTSLFVSMLPYILGNIEQANHAINQRTYYEALEAMREVIDSITNLGIIDDHDYQEHLRPAIGAVLQRLTERDETITPAEQLLKRI